MKFVTYGNYIYAPIFATAVWFATLLGLLLWWVATDDAKAYQRDEATVVFISDSGAAHKWFFILGTGLTLAGFTMTLLFERWLRHVDRIPGTVRSRERTFDILAIVFGIAGSVALLLLSIFDAFNHSTIHWSLTVVFIVCIALCAIFQTAEIFALKKDHPDRKHLKRNAIIKIAVVTLAVILAICFGGTYAACSGNGGPAYGSRCNIITSVAAALEWTIAMLYDLFLATFILDLWPAAKTSPRHLRRHERHIREKGLLHESGNTSPTMSAVRPSEDTTGLNFVSQPYDAASHGQQMHYATENRVRMPQPVALMSGNRGSMV